jgi:hypothetical protein
MPARRRASATTATCLPRRAAMPKPVDAGARINKTLSSVRPGWPPDGNGESQLL